MPQSLKFLERHAAFRACLSCALNAAHQAITENGGQLSEDTIGAVYDAINAIDRARKLSSLDMKAHIESTKAESK